MEATKAPGSTFDPEAARVELDKMRVDDTKNSADIARFLAQEPSQRIKTFKWGELEIRVKGFIPRKIRYALAEVENKSDIKSLQDIVDIESKVYEVIAGICIDPPYNESDTWREIDSQSGCVFDVLTSIMSDVMTPREGVEPFRKK